jgi:hypothetical protein
MKKLLLFSILFSCKKSNNSSPAVSAAHGCVTCVTTVKAFGTNSSGNIVNQVFSADTEFCYISDSVLNAYIQAQTENQTVYPGNPNLYQTRSTVCKN